MSFHRLATSANSRQVVLLLLCDKRGLIQTIASWLRRLGGIVWTPADASFDFVTWFGLGVPFGQGLGLVIIYFDDVVWIFCFSCCGFTSGSRFMSEDGDES